VHGIRQISTNPNCENTRESQKGNSGELEGYLRGVETDSELARETWGGTLAERFVRGMGSDGWFFSESARNVELGQR